MSTPDLNNMFEQMKKMAEMMKEAQDKMPSTSSTPSVQHFCSQCGAAVTGGKFCAQCGAALSIPAASSLKTDSMQPIAKEMFKSLLEGSLQKMANDPEHIKKMQENTKNKPKTLGIRWVRFNEGSWAQYEIGGASNASQAAAGQPGSGKAGVRMTLMKKSATEIILKNETVIMDMLINTGESSLILDPAADAQMKHFLEGAHVSEETLVINGKTVHCKVFDIQQTIEGAQMQSRSWISEDVPGGMVKVEGHVKRGDGVSGNGGMTLVDFEAK